MAKKAKIFLYDYIGSGSITAADIAAQITNAQDQGVTEFEIRINSMGGDAFQGVALFNLIKEIKPVVYIDGVAASIASVIAMAGSKIYMAKNALMMIHNPWTYASGEEKDLEKAKEILVKMKESIVAAYKSKTGIDESDLIKLMDEETWFNADEALEKKFVDEIFEQKLEQKEYVAVYCSIQNLKPNKGAKKMNKQILAFFGLPETATEAELEAKLTLVRTELGLSDTAGITEIMAKIKESITADPPADPPAVKTADQKVDEFIANQLKANAEALIDSAIQAGKILPTDKETFLLAANADFAKCKANLDARPKGMLIPNKIKVAEKKTEGDEKVSNVNAAAEFFKTQGRTPLVNRAG